MYVPMVQKGGGGQGVNAQMWGGASDGLTGGRCTGFKQAASAAGSRPESTHEI